MSETSSTQITVCWCGERALLPFSDHYLRCPTCETLVAVQRPAGDVTLVEADEQGLYGKDYWFGHQQHDVGLPDIRHRVRADLPERCVYWLRTLLKFKPPPAKVQELGSAHGGFVAMMRQAGYDATGLELSPWIVEFARRSFDVPMLQGPLENQPIAAGSLDALVLMDVLEHLPDPVGTMRHAIGLLKQDGMLLIQTPRCPEGVTYEQLTAREDYFVNHMSGKHEEHLFLFSRTAVRELFKRLGCETVQFEPAIFSQYDMYFAVSRGSLPEFSKEASEDALLASPGGRMVQALLDAAERRDYYLSEANARMKVIDDLVREVERLRNTSDATQP